MKKRSERLDEPYVFFIDRCLGRKIVPEKVSSAIEGDERVETHDGSFEQDEKDAVWLETVGARQWVVLSQDLRISRNPLELQALLRARVAFFGVGASNAPASDVGLILARALPVIRRALRRFKLPIIATVHPTGDVTVKWEHGKQRKPPVRLQPKHSRQRR